MWTWARARSSTSRAWHNTTRVSKLPTTKRKLSKYLWIQLQLWAIPYAWKLYLSIAISSISSCASSVRLRDSKILIWFSRICKWVFRNFTSRWSVSTIRQLMSTASRPSCCGSSWRLSFCRQTAIVSNTQASPYWESEVSVVRTWLMPSDSCARSSASWNRSTSCNFQLREFSETINLPSGLLNSQSAMNRHKLFVSNYTLDKVARLLACYKKINQQTDKLGSEGIWIVSS